jgi:hypothetical protein
LPISAAAGDEITFQETRDTGFMLASNCRRSTASARAWSNGFIVPASSP